MRKITIAGGLAAILAGLALVSCSFGLQPSWKNADTSTRVAMQFAIPRADGSRAIAPGNGYLYIRTFGGPTGEKGPAYGPFLLSKDSPSFTTTDIPAGEYSKFQILVSLIPLENKTYTNPVSGSTISFKDMMSSSDADFEAYSDGENSPFDSIVAGISTGTILENVKILEGKTTTITATLTPMVNGLTDASGGAGITYMLPITTERTGRYFAIGNLNPGTVPLNELRVSATPEGAAFVYTIAFYDSQGNQQALIKPNAALSTNYLFTLPFSGNPDGYMYIEYSGNILWTFVPFNFTGAQNNLRVNFTFDALSAPGSSFVGKKLFVGVYAAAAVTSNGPPSEAPLGVGLTTLTNSGNASIQINAPGTNTAANFTTIGQNLVIMAFIDMKNKYSNTYTDTASLTAAEVAIIQPQYGDYATDKPPLHEITTGWNSYELTASYMIPNSNYTIYVSQIGTQDGTGNSPSSSVTLAEALSLGATLTEVDHISIMLTESISLNDTVTFDGPYHISSNSQTPYTISDGRGATITDTPLIRVMNATQSPDTYLHLENVIIDGNGNFRSANYAPGIEVTQNAHLDLAEGAVVRNFSNTATTSLGGAVFLNDGSLKIAGGTISGNSAGSGGGVYASYNVSGSHITFESGTINGNEAVYGGGIYLQMNTSLQLLPGNPLPSITVNNASMEGGGLYLSGGSFLQDPGEERDNIVTGNSSSGTSMNIFLGDGAIISTEITQVFVSADGTGDGLMYDTPASFAAVAAGLDDSFANVNSIALTSDVTLPATMVIPAGRTIHIFSNNSTNYRIAPANNISGPLISVSGGMPGGSLNLNRVTLGPETTGITTYSLISAGVQTSVSLQVGTILENNTSTQNGSGVFMSGGSLYIVDSTIQNCTTTGNGGGIYLESNGTYYGTLNFINSVITGCQADSGAGLFIGGNGTTTTVNSGQIASNTATTNGGGVYVSSGGMFAVNYYSGNPYLITLNQAALGGGIFYEMYQNFLDSSIDTQVTGNTATNNATYNDIYNPMI